MPEALRLKTCKFCGGYFRPERKSQVYCNDECRNGYYDRLKVVTKKTCPRCGTEFETTKPIRQVYCSPGCRDTPAAPEGTRPRAEACELCAKSGVMLFWHNLNEDHKTGLYLCRECRAFARKFNQKIVEGCRNLIKQEQQHG